MKIVTTMPETRELVSAFAMLTQHMYLNTRSSAVFIRNRVDMWVTIDPTGVGVYTQKELENYPNLRSEIFYRAPEGYKITFQE